MATCLSSRSRALGRDHHRVADVAVVTSRAELQDEREDGEEASGDGARRSASDLQAPHRRARAEHDAHRRARASTPRRGSPTRSRAGASRSIARARRRCSSSMGSPPRDAPLRAPPLERRRAPSVASATSAASCESSRASSKPCAARPRSPGCSRSGAHPARVREPAVVAHDGIDHAAIAERLELGDRLDGPVARERIGRGLEQRLSDLVVLASRRRSPSARARTSALARAVAGAPVAPHPGEHRCHARFTPLAPRARQLARARPSRGSHVSRAASIGDAVGREPRVLAGAQDRDDALGLLARRRPPRRARANDGRVRSTCRARSRRCGASTSASRARAIAPTAAGRTSPLRRRSLGFRASLYARRGPGRERRWRAARVTRPRCRP